MSQNLIKQMGNQPQLKPLSLSHTLSIVIASYNCEERIEQTILPWSGLAQEIIVVDQNSSDKTAEIAKTLGCVVTQNLPPDGNFNLNRRLGMEQAKSNWILYMDTDERPTDELLTEIQNFLISPPLGIEGVQIPNLFYFLGKPLRYGLYSKHSAELRMFQKGKWSYPTEDSVHRSVTVEGGVFTFKNPYRHFNVNSLSEWFMKTNQYTEHDVSKRNASIRTYSAFYQAFCFFIKNYFFRLGFLDGFRGLLSVFYFMLYHLTLEVKGWERSQWKSLEYEKDWIKPFLIPKR